MTDLRSALDAHHRAVDAFVQTARGLPPARWDQPRAPGKWSPGQVAEHLTLAYQVNRDLLHGGPPPLSAPRFLRPLIRIFLLGPVLRRGGFFPGTKAPRIFRPGPTPGPPDELLSRLEATTNGFEADSEALGSDVVDHPFFGRLPLRDFVLLIHGLARTPLSLLGLARDLRRAGHRTELVAYSGALESYAGIVARVRRRLELAALGGEPYAVVGHSLGGVIVRAALDGWPADRLLPAHLIMLGTPNHVPRLARRFRRWWPYRLVNGECGQLLADAAFFARLPLPPVPTTVIAGTKNWPRLSWFDGRPNDGVVAVDEARLGPPASLVELRASHTFMMNNRQLRATVRDLLARAAA
jgi:pimeloyl-ACP methyl ester carboxylesterase